MMTAAEMSAILGASVVAEADEDSSSKCRYHPAGRSMPSIEIQVDRGGGRMAMTSTRMLGQLEPGMAERLGRLGDEAATIGPALWVRTGEDLVMLTMFGVDDHVAIAARVLELLRPRLGPSAQSQAAAARGAGNGANTGAESTSEGAAAEQAAQLAGGLLSQLLAGNRGAARERGPGGANAGDPAGSGSGSSGPGGSDPEGRRRTSSASAVAEELAFAPAKGELARVPLIAGLTIIGAQHEPPRGDYEPMMTFTSVTNDGVSLVFSATLPEGHRIAVDRDIRREDLLKAREYRPWYQPGDPRAFPGTTALQLSSAVYTELKTTGRAVFTQIVEDDDNPLASVVSRLAGGSGNVLRRTATMQRVEPHALAFPILLNDEPAEVPAIHVRGTIGDDTVDMYVLDDEQNPLVLLAAGRLRGRVVRIAFPTPEASPIEEKLKKDARVELHGIYFDFGRRRCGRSPSPCCATSPRR